MKRHCKRIVCILISCLTALLFSSCHVFDNFTSPTGVWQSADHAIIINFDGYGTDGGTLTHGETTERIETYVGMGSDSRYFEIASYDRYIAKGGLSDDFLLIGHLSYQQENLHLKVEISHLDGYKEGDVIEFEKRDASFWTSRYYLREAPKGVWADKDGMVKLDFDSADEENAFTGWLQVSGQEKQVIFYYENPVVDMYDRQSGQVEPLMVGVLYRKENGIGMEILQSFLDESAIGREWLLEKQP